MNQPTEDRFKRLEEEQRHLREEVRQLREQITEPMKVTRIELDPGGIQNRLDNHAEMMKEQDEMLSRIYTDVGKVNTEIASLKGGTAEVKAIVANLKATQSDHGELIKSNEKITHEVRNTVDRIEEHMYKQDDRIMQIEGYMVQILNRMPKAEGE